MPDSPHARQRREPLVVGPRGDDAAVELGRRVEVVVVGGQAGRRRARRPAPASACRACSRPPCPSPRTTRTMSSTRSKRRPSGTSRQAAPMQNRVAPCSRARVRRLGQLVERHEIGPRHVGLVVRRLRTVGAVLGAAAGLDAEQHAALHLVGAGDARGGPPARETRGRAAAPCRSPRFRRPSSRGRSGGVRCGHGNRSICLTSLARSTRAAPAAPDRNDDQHDRRIARRATATYGLNFASVVAVPHRKQISALSAISVPHFRHCMDALHACDRHHGDVQLVRSADRAHSEASAVDVARQLADRVRARAA